jgi:hypothetical protein
MKLWLLRAWFSGASSQAYQLAIDQPDNLSHKTPHGAAAAAGDGLWQFALIAGTVLRPLPFI